MDRIMNKISLLIILVGIMAMGFSSLMAQADWQSVTTADITLEYRVTQDRLNLECRLTGATTGWVAVGFNPTSVMRNANIIIGYVSGDNTQIRDDWGNSNTSHVSDTSLGGTSDVTLISGSEAAGSTVLHFTIPLVTTDQYDRPLVIGQSYPIIMAQGANNADNYTGMHADAGNAQITLISPVSNDDPLLGWMGTGVLSAYPNPFHASTTLRYSMKDSAPAILSVYNQRGQLVLKQELSGSRGENEQAWNPSGLGVGAYFLRLQSSSGVSTGRITVLKR